MAASFCPAGLESESEDDDYDFFPSVNRREHNTHNGIREQPILTNQAPATDNGRAPWSKLKPKAKAKPVMMKGHKEAASNDDFKNAITRGQIEQIEMYLKDGFTVDALLAASWSGLMYAGNWAKPDIVELLLKHGADPNYHNDRYTVLMATCSSGKYNEAALLECVNILLEYGAHYNDFDRHHMSPLMYASREGRGTVVKRLIDAGANINKQDTRGYTALIWACYKGHIRVVQLLLENEADANMTSIDGSKASDVANAQEHTQIISILGAHSKGDPLAEDWLKTTVDSHQTTAGESRHEASPDKCVQYGDLEMFLCGIELSNLIPHFQSHKITFQTFLKMTDRDLQQVGVRELGFRKKILDAVRDTHKVDWEPTSVPSSQYDKPITCPEAVAMLSNISKHMDYIATQVCFIKDRIQTEPDILNSGKEGATVDEFINKTDESMTNTCALYDQLRDLGCRLAKITKKKDYRPVDLIRQTRRRGAKNNRKLVAFCGLIVVGTSVVGLWKYEAVVEQISCLLKPMPGD